jgi:hypothetical protein
MLLLAWLTPKVVSAGPTLGDSHRCRPVLRPGSAAAPFEWATVVADFDGDQAPDVAIADRVDGIAGSQYQIDVHLFEGPTQSLSFVSTDGALNITALDIDNDRDADLIVRPVLSRKVIGAWLNDGTGHFDRGDTSVFPPLAPRITTASLNGLPHQLQASVTPRRRILSGLGSVSTIPPLTSSGLDQIVSWLSPAPRTGLPRRPALRLFLAADHSLRLT